MRASDKVRWNINSIKVNNWSVTVSAITMAMPQKINVAWEKVLQNRHYLAIIPFSSGCKVLVLPVPTTGLLVPRSQEMQQIKDFRSPQLYSSHRIDTSGFEVNIRGKRLIVVDLRCHRHLKFGNFTIFCQFVGRTCSKIMFSSLNQSQLFYGIGVAVCVVFAKLPRSDIGRRLR